MNIYHKTSVDRTTISTVGRKRTYDELQGPTTHAPIAPKSMLAHVANQGAFQFQRPTVQEQLLSKSLRAGVIRDVGKTRGPSEYSQRRTLALTPAPSSNPFLSLSHPAYGLPLQLVQNLASLGINSIYPWQSECLLKSGALHGKQNLVYTAPTGGGKSLVADIIMLKKMIETPGKKALLVLPYVALVQEKLRWLRKVVEGIKRSSFTHLNEQKPGAWMKRGDEDAVRVVGFFGGNKSKATWADMDIAVCTIEKANLLVNAAIEDFNVGKLGVVVIDELHMIDDDSRGYILELMATKLLCLDEQVQVVGMSATLNNAELLAKWLGNARYYVSKYRPVPVEEHLVFENLVYPASTSRLFCNTATQLSNLHSQASTQIKSEPTRIIDASTDKELSNPLVNSVVSLANETARAGYGALVFCSSRAGSERDAELISQVLPRPSEVDPLVMERRIDLLNDLRSTTTGVDRLLENTVPVGVAFHHAGLTTEERDLIATAYDQGVLKVIVATCSLAAGINLPARRVILHGARMGAELVGPSMLRQMRGRAGRKGKDEIGETYLCCRKADLEEVAELMGADIPNVESCLMSKKQGIQRALLEVIAIKLATSDESVDDYVKKTLLYHSTRTEELESLEMEVQSTLKDLLNMTLLEINNSHYSATLLGQAIVASSLTPEDGLFVHREMQKALAAFVLDGDLHALYTFTPVQSSYAKINWQIFRKEVEALDESNMKVLSFVGLSPVMVNKMAQGATLKENTKEEMELVRIYRRFYTALQLRDLCNEMPIYAVARKYEIPRGTVQNLAQTCHGFAAGMIKFCERMGWSPLSVLLDHFSDRLRAGAKADLLALAQIQFIKSRTARVFWENGFKTVGAVAAADVKDILPVLLLAQPKKLKVDDEQEKKYHEKLLLRAAQISKSANLKWEQQLREEIDEEE